MKDTTIAYCLLMFVSTALFFFGLGIHTATKDIGEELIKACIRVQAYYVGDTRIDCVVK